MSKKFPATQGKPISKDEIRRRMDLFQAKYPGATNGSFIGKDKLKDVMNTPKASGVMIYYTLNDAGEISPVFLACTEEGDLIYEGGDGKDTAKSGLNDTLNCPPNCPNGQP